MHKDYHIYFGNFFEMSQLDRNCSIIFLRGEFNCRLVGFVISFSEEVFNFISLYYYSLLSSLKIFIFFDLADARGFSLAKQG